MIGFLSRALERFFLNGGVSNERRFTPIGIFPVAKLDRALYGTRRKGKRTTAQDKRRAMKARNRKRCR